MVHRIGAEQVGSVGQVALFPPEMRDYDRERVGGIGISAGPARETAMGESAVSESRKFGAWFRDSAIRFGILAFVVTLVLRFVGVVVGPVAVVLAIVAIVLLPGPDWWADRFLIAAAALLGWLPLLGWIPKLGSKVDVEGILLAVVVGIAVAAQLRARRTGRGSRERITPAEATALAVGAAVSIWWAIPFLRQSVAGRLRMLLPSGGLTLQGWDNATHLDLLHLNIQLGSFVTVQPNSPAGVKYFGQEYPQGWHQMWAQWIRLWYRAPSSSARSLVDMYTVALVVTAAVAVMLGCVAVARLCRDHTFASLVSMSVVAQLFAVGVMSISVYAGFPNIGLAVVAVAVAPSLLLRPSLRPPATFFVVSGLMLVGVYNWWPLALLAAPTVAVATLRLWQYAGGKGRRAVAAAAIVLTALAMAAPIVLTLHLGASHLLTNGGIPQTPWWLVLAATLALIAAVAVRQVITHETVISFVFGAPAIAGGLGVIALVAYELSSTPVGGVAAVSYYGEKLGDVVAAASLVALALLLADAMSRITPQLRQSRSRGVLVGLAAVLAGVAIFQINGYVGPRQQTLTQGQAAPGFVAQQHWSRFDASGDPLADSFLDAVDSTRAQIAQTGELPESFSYVSIEGLDPRTDWVDYWFTALVGGMDPPRVDRAYHMYGLYQVTDPVAAARIVTQMFPIGTEPAVRLVVPASMVTPLVQLGWTVGVNVFAPAA
jgi:hypothetical protein